MKKRIMILIACLLILASVNIASAMNFQQLLASKVGYRLTFFISGSTQVHSDIYGATNYTYFIDGVLTEVGDDYVFIRGRLNGEGNKGHFHVPISNITFFAQYEP